MFCLSLSLVVGCCLLCLLFVLVALVVFLFMDDPLVFSTLGVSLIGWLSGCYCFCFFGFVVVVIVVASSIVVGLSG